MSLVYADKPQTLDHLEDNIRRVIADIRPQMLEKVIENWTSRLDYMRASRGSPMPEIILKMFQNIMVLPLSLHSLREKGAGAFLASNYIPPVAEKGSLGMSKGCGEDPRRDHAINFEIQAAICTCDDYFHKEADSQLCGGNRYRLHFGTKSEKDID
ncbi:hypothetical protein TNCV_3398911 [Trichonephila clavipes]|nr:hypothetical protein TNCV_3398911 [Trichonephila clavipes]